jgi:hypothetical protein
MKGKEKNKMQLWALFAFGNQKFGGASKRLRRKGGDGCTERDVFILYVKQHSGHPWLSTKTSHT